MTAKKQAFLPVIILPLVFLIVFVPSFLNKLKQPKIKGIVRDSAGVPAANIQVKIFPAGDQDKTDKEGRYSLKWQFYNRGARDPIPCVIARDFKRNLAALSDISERVTNVDLTLKPGLSVGGLVFDPTGRPIANAILHLSLMGVKRGGSWIDSSSNTCDINGHFEITAIPAEVWEERRYYVDASADGYGSTNAEVPQDDFESNHMELPPIVLKVADQRVAGQVVFEDGKPAYGVQLTVTGDGQQFLTTTSSINGSFVFNSICEGSLSIYAFSPAVCGRILTISGETNALITLDRHSNKIQQPQPKRASLVGKKLPDLAGLGFSGETVKTGKPILLCLADIEQRPSRRLLTQINSRSADLSAKGLVVLGIQAVALPVDGIKAWKEANPIYLPMGMVPDKSLRWATETPFLPWLILVDSRGLVVAEGFALDELENYFARVK
jgi:hypothetical protein